MLLQEPQIAITIMILPSRSLSLITYELLFDDEELIESKHFCGLYELSESEIHFKIVACHVSATRQLPFMI